MNRIALVVEGHGDAQALPMLIRRIAAIESPTPPFELLKPLRVRRQLIVKPGELERIVEFAARQSGPAGKILILLDADEDCPMTLARDLLARARSARSDRMSRVVVAKREFEAWFLAAAQSLAGKRGFVPSMSRPADPEEVGSPKAWLAGYLTGRARYAETVDQPALAELIDLEEAKCSPSFRKLWRDVIELLKG